MRSETYAGFSLILLSIGIGTGAHADQNALSGLIPPFDGAPQLSIRSASPQKSNISTSLGNPLWAIPLASLTATRERPIFSRSRRPALLVQATPIRKETPPVVVEQPTRPLLTLLGAIAGDEDGIAILVDEATKNVVRMKTGEKFSGWMLSSVGKRSATFQMARQVAVLVIPIP